MCSKINNCPFIKLENLLFSANFMHRYDNTNLTCSGHCQTTENCIRFGLTPAFGLQPIFVIAKSKINFDKKNSKNIFGPKRKKIKN